MKYQPQEPRRCCWLYQGVAALSPAAWVYAHQVHTLLWLHRIHPCRRDCELPLLLALGMKSELTEATLRVLLEHLEALAPWRTPVVNNAGGGSAE